MSLDESLAAAIIQAAGCDPRGEAFQSGVVIKTLTKTGLETVIFLLTHGADPNGRSRTSGKEFWRSMLLICVDRNIQVDTALQCAKLLLDSGADMNDVTEVDLGAIAYRWEQPPRSRIWPLQFASKSAHAFDFSSCPDIPFVQFLLDQGCNPNIRDELGETVLMGICKILINKKSNEEMASEHDYKFYYQIKEDLDRAEEAYYQCFALLLTHGADPNIADNDGKSPVSTVTDAHPILYQGLQAAGQRAPLK